MLDHMYQKATYLEWRPGKLAIRRRQRWPARAAGRRNMRGQLHRIYAPARQSLMRVLHQPIAVVPVQDHIRGDRNPLSLIVVCGPLQFQSCAWGTYMLASENPYS